MSKCYLRKIKLLLLLLLLMPAVSTPYPLLALNCLPFCLLYYLLLQVDYPLLGYPLLLSTAKLILVEVFCMKNRLAWWQIDDYFRLQSKYSVGNVVGSFCKKKISLKTMKYSSLYSVEEDTWIVLRNALL